MFEHIRTDGDIAAGVSTSQVIRRELGVCWEDMKQAYKVASSGHKLRLAYWMWRYTYGMMTRPMHSKETVKVHVMVHGKAHPVSFRKNQSDLFILREIFLQGIYDFPYEKFVPKVDVIVDLGANAGLAASFFQARFPKARLVCVEPVPDNAEMIRTNRETCRGSWNIEQAAISHNEEPLEFFASEWWSSGTAIEDIGVTRQSQPNRVEHKLSLPKMTVPAVTMEGIMNKYNFKRVNVLKMDVEGVEEVLMDNAENWIDRVDAVIVEIHDRYIDGHKVRQRFREYGFTEYKHHGPCEVYVREGKV